MLEQTSIQERIEYLVTNGLGYKPDKTRDLLRKEDYDATLDLQLHLCNLNLASNEKLRKYLKECIDTFTSIIE